MIKNALDGYMLTFVDLVVGTRVNLQDFKVRRFFCKFPSCLDNFIGFVYCGVFSLLMEGKLSRSLSLSQGHTHGAPPSPSIIRRIEFPKSPLPSSRHHEINPGSCVVKIESKMTTVEAPPRAHFSRMNFHI